MPFCEHTLLNGLSFNICFDKIFISQDFWNELELALFGIIDLLIKKMFNLYSSLFTILWHKTWRKPQLVINGKIVIHSCLTNQFSGKNCTGCLKKTLEFSVFEIFKLCSTIFVLTEILQNLYIVIESFPQIPILEYLYLYNQMI